MFELDDSNIALESDRNAMFQQVEGFQYRQISNLNTSCSQSSLPSGCKQYCDQNTNQCYNYYYPDDDTVQYLYETYPNQISPIDGVTDQHFIVWMRTEILPTFRKLYGRMAGPFSKGNVLVINIVANYDVSKFKGTKSLVLTSLGSFGGKNTYLGLLFMISGSIFLAMGVFMYISEWLLDRKMKKDLLL